MSTKTRMCLFLVCVTIVLGGCSVSPWLRAKNNNYVTGKVSSEDSSDPVSKLMRIHCISRDEDVVDTNESGKCMYTSADITDLLKQTSTLGLLSPPPESIDLKERRNLIIDKLIYISDTNCKVFRDHVFANKTTMHMLKDALSDILNAGVVPAAFLSGPAGAALGITNMAVGKFSDNIDKNLFMERTFSAMKAAIMTEVAKKKDPINTGRAQSLGDYPITQALSDVDSYNSACSFSEGIRALEEIANKEKQSAENATKDKTAKEKFSVTPTTNENLGIGAVMQIHALKGKISKATSSNKTVAKVNKVAPADDGASGGGDKEKIVEVEGVATGSADIAISDDDGNTSTVTVEVP